MVNRECAEGFIQFVFDKVENDYKKFNMKPILFNTAMVKAILEGQKTCTRRVIKDSQCYLNKLERRKISPFEFIESGFCKNNWDDVKKIKQNFRRPFDIGDILYVRETWKKYTKRIGNGENSMIAEFYGYKADEDNPNNSSEFYEGNWRPSIHMPKAAARIFLEVINVRIERLNDIDDEGAKAEGSNTGIGIAEKMREGAIDRFKRIWDSTVNKKYIDKYCWDSGPWVWVIEFKILTTNGEK